MSVREEVRRQIIDILEVDYFYNLDNITQRDKEMSMLLKHFVDSGYIFKELEVLQIKRNVVVKSLTTSWTSEEELYIEYELIGDVVDGTKTYDLVLTGKHQRNLIKLYNLLHNLNTLKEI